ncbi:MAG TPA: hypothetical protein VN999_10135 [Thermoanaerobaculia bacterium]|nr:hypothetical protein [Thermoanaerobaculia bacterium]
MRPAPQPLVRLVLVLFVVWAGAAMAYRTGAALTGWDTRRADRLACEWSLGTGPVTRLERCLAGVEGWVPRDSVVVFDSAPGPCNSQFFRWRWAAYLLPELEVSLPDDPDGSRLATYLIAYRTEPAPPPGSRLVLVRQLADGRLYRIHRP